MHVEQSSLSMEENAKKLGDAISIMERLSVDRKNSSGGKKLIFSKKRKGRSSGQGKKAALAGLGAICFTSSVKGEKDEAQRLSGRIKRASFGGVIRCVSLRRWGRRSRYAFPGKRTGPNKRDHDIKGRDVVVFLNGLSAGIRKVRRRREKIAQKGVAVASMGPTGSERKTEHMA